MMLEDGQMQPADIVALLTKVYVFDNASAVVVLQHRETETSTFPPARDGDGWKIGQHWTRRPARKLPSGAVRHCRRPIASSILPCAQFNYCLRHNVATFNPFVRCKIGPRPLLV